MSDILDLMGVLLVVALRYPIIVIITAVIAYFFIAWVFSAEAPENDK